MKSRLLSVFLAAAFCYLLLESGTCLLVKMNRIQGDVPSFSLGQIGARFWREINPDFGVWHEPHSEFLHEKSCFAVQYRANAEGMRDKERARSSAQARTVMLGDSFVEGWGVEDGKRVSDLLETATGREVLNFGTSGHFSPTQYYLVYKTLAKNFSHDAVLVGVLPSNDFQEDDFEQWKDQGRYRPFWVGNPPELVYTKASLGKVDWRRYVSGFFREFSYLYNAVKFAVMARHLNTTASPSPSQEIPSKFYDFSEAEYERMLFSLQKIREEAQGKRVSVFLIPILSDLKRYDKSGKSPLAARLEAWGQANEVQVIDLLPWMHDHSADWAKYYFPCDEHWSAYGHQVAFEYLKEKLK